MFKKILNSITRPITSILTPGKEYYKPNYISYSPFEYKPLYSNISKNIGFYRAHKPSLDKSIKDTHSYLNNFYNNYYNNDTEQFDFSNYSKEQVEDMLIDMYEVYTDNHVNLINAFKV